MPTRAEWQQLAEERILDAQALLAAGRWSAAFYLVGYAIECGLKACVLAHVAAHPEVIYDERRFSNEAWTHDAEVLVRLAGLEAARDNDAAANQALYDNWQQLKKWSEVSRYRRIDEVRAKDLVNAITDLNNGVMPWIRAHW